MTSSSPAASDGEDEWRDIEASLKAIKEKREAAEAALEAVRQDQALAVLDAVERGFQRGDVGQAVGFVGPAERVPNNHARLPHEQAALDLDRDG
jgi:hypothetical protein